MIKAISLEATLALGGGRSAFSRYADYAPADHVSAWDN
jgi:hypothetical protein